MIPDLKLLNRVFCRLPPPAAASLQFSRNYPRFLIMLHRRLILIGALLSFAISSLVAIESCPAASMPGMPGIPGLPGRDGRDGQKGLKETQDLRCTVLSGLRREKRGIRGRLGLLGNEDKAENLENPESRARWTSGRTRRTRQQAAFSVARGTNSHPEQASVIRFTNVITNINDDYNTETGRFRCRVSGTYYFVYHASLDEKTVCADEARPRSAGIVLDQEVWLETKDYRGMTGKQQGYSIFSGFLLHSH
ncbi:hypothetical protein F7725_016407 [Dissostichus mawsoni]|uniref:C1q domain-containing protein n=1 Tax=Dissostichus mawsoni TaxID=36200 RepID=A0A7J5Z1M1_DISMA|nr:hypothetical protein F7725_016407 [Dissostichus mawsoni]